MGTDAVAARVVHGTKLAVYGSYDLVTPHALAVGGAIGVVMVIGSLLGRRLLDRMSGRTFAVVIETVMVASGLQFLLLG